MPSGTPKHLESFIGICRACRSGYLNRLYALQRQRQRASEPHKAVRQARGRRETSEPDTDSALTKGVVILLALGGIAWVIWTYFWWIVGTLASIGALYLMFRLWIVPRFGQWLRNRRNDNFDAGGDGVDVEIEVDPPSDSAA